MSIIYSLGLNFDPIEEGLDTESDEIKEKKDEELKYINKMKEDQKVKWGKGRWTS